MVAPGATSQVLLGNTVLNFPAMPDAIELARSAEYHTVPNIDAPDGVHMYMGTNPLSIPFMFKLHAFDQKYCKEGALSVLRAAALLHAMVLPVRPGVNTNVATTSQQQNPGAVPGGSVDATASRSQGSAGTVNTAAYPNAAPSSSPVAVLLQVMFTDNADPGIWAVGYIKDVKARLLGPWLRGPKDARNLPTAGEFEFTFVHVPGYNSRGSSSVYAYADDVNSLLYNTSSLVPANAGSSSTPSAAPSPGPGFTPAPAGSVSPFPGFFNPA
jgi:hypothetical protein